MMVPLEIDLDHARMIVGGKDHGKAHILHCNYYNNYLMRTIWKDAGQFLSSEPLLIGSAVEQSYFQLKGLFETLNLRGLEERKAFASNFYSWQGFGLLDFGAIDASGGTTISDSQHYAEGWKEQFGTSDAPVGFMTRGWLAGAASAILDLPQDHFSTHQTVCAAETGGHRNIFELKPDGANYSVFDGKGVGPLSASHTLCENLAGNIDAAAVGAAVLTLPLFGSQDVDGGLIRSFDVMITWHPHQYYDRISFECVNEAIRKYGTEGRHVVEPLLEEAGHRCGFRTFGGIWRSPEWEAVVEPMCETRQDWVFGLLAIINCVGWGRVECTKLTREEAVFVVHDDYESVGYLNLYGRADFATTYLFPGGFRAIMNLLYNGNIEEKPPLTEAFYEALSRRADSYRTTTEKCLSMGDEVSLYRVTRKTA